MTLPPPLLCKKTFDTRNFLKPGRVPLRNFSVLSDKTISPGNRDTRPPLLSLTFFDTRNFLKHRRVPLRNVSVLWDKFLTENRDTLSFPLPSLIHKILILRYQIFSEAQKVSPTKFFGTVRQQIFDGKSWCPLFLLSLTFFDARNFLKHRRVPLRNFSALWDKKFSTENRVTLLLKVQKSVVELRFVKNLWKLNSKQ